MLTRGTSILHVPEAQGSFPLGATLCTYAVRAPASGGMRTAYRVPCTVAPQAVLDYGILICIHCAGAHRALGSHISKVVSSYDRIVVSYRPA